MSKNDQPFHHTNVTSTYWFLKVCIISMVICWLCPFQPLALVSLWLSSRLQLLKSAPLCPRKRVCIQTDQVPGTPPCRTSQTLALAQRETADRGGLWAAGLGSATAWERSNSMRLVLGSRVAENVWGTPSSCAQGMVTKGKDSTLGLLGTGSALGPAPKSLPMKDAGWRMLLHVGGPITPMSECHHPAMQHSQCPGAG